MKKPLFLLLSLIFLKSYWIFGQVCGTPHPVNPVIYSDNSNARGASSAYCVNVFFYVVRNTDESNAFALPNTDDIVEELNEFYSPHNIIINNAGIGFINNTDFVNIDDPDEAATLGQTNNRPDAINYYIVETLWNTLRGSIIGTAISIPSNNLVIREDRVLTSTSSHEFGHCLNLLHTFETARGVEAINGSNCSSAGDLVCDTPADQDLGNMYGRMPDLTNIMSYYRPRDHFTNTQGYRMRIALANKSVLDDLTSNSCVRITEVDNVCYSQSKTLTLSNLNGVTATWTSSANVQFLSSNGSSATIRAINGTSLGEGWVQANLNDGIQLREILDVGPPTISNLPYSLHIGESFTMGSFYLGTWNRVHVICNVGCTHSATQNMDWNITATSSAIMHSSGLNNALIRPNSSQIRVSYEAFNECGCSATRFQNFNVVGGSSEGSSSGWNNPPPSNGDPILIPIDDGGILDPDNASGGQFIPTKNNN